MKKSRKKGTFFIQENKGRMTKIGHICVGSAFSFTFVKEW